MKTPSKDYYKKNSSTNFVYAAGFAVNPIENVSVNVSYKGTKANIYGKRSINGFNISVGYRF